MEGSNSSRFGTSSSAVIDSSTTSLDEDDWWSIERKKKQNILLLWGAWYLGNDRFGDLVREKLENKTYIWGNSTITFLDNFKMDAFGEGSYNFIDNKNIIAKFGGREHNIKFNEDYTYFTSTRIDDLQIVNGKIKYWILFYTFSTSWYFLFNS